MGWDSITPHTGEQLAQNRNQTQGSGCDAWVLSQGATRRRCVSVQWMMKLNVCTCALMPSCPERAGRHVARLAWQIHDTAAQRRRDRRASWQVGTGMNGACARALQGAPACPRSSTSTVTWVTCPYTHAHGPVLSGPRVPRRCSHLLAPRHSLLDTGRTWRYQERAPRQDRKMARPARVGA